MRSLGWTLQSGHYIASAPNPFILNVKLNPSKLMVKQSCRVGMPPSCPVWRPVNRFAALSRIGALKKCSHPGSAGAAKRRRFRNCVLSRFLNDGAFEMPPGAVEFEQILDALSPEKQTQLVELLKEAKAASETQ